MNVWIAIFGFALVAVLVVSARRKIVGQLDDIAAAVAAAKNELAADVAKVSAKIDGLSIPQAEKDALIAEIAGFGTALDHLHVEVPTEPVEPPVEPVEPPVEPPAEPTEPPVNP